MKTFDMLICISILKLDSMIVTSNHYAITNKLLTDIPKYHLPFIDGKYQQ